MEKRRRKGWAGNTTLSCILKKNNTILMSAALGYALLVAGPGLALYTTFLGGRAFLLLVTLAR